MWIFNCKLSDNLSRLSASFFLNRFIINTCNNDNDDDDDDKRNGLLSTHEIAIKSINEVSMYSRGLCTYQCKPRGGEGVRARGGDLTNFKIFQSNSPGWETKGQSKVSKKPPPQGKKSKQTML